jgi:hypothetical protein
MDKQHAKAIQEYQCTGCFTGPFPHCYKKSEKGEGIGCADHQPATIMGPAGLIFLGMPRGFCRLGGINAKLRLHIFPTFKEGWGYGIWNVPVWKYLSPAGHTMVRGLSPRNNFPFLHVYLEDCRDQINCLEVTQADVDYMD